MTNNQKLRLIKFAHTGIWIFFNIVIFYILYAAIIFKIDAWLFICLAIVSIEGLILLIFNNFCPLTVLARNYSQSTSENFDIFLPKWLARHNKRIYLSIVLASIAIILIRLLIAPEEIPLRCRF